MDSVVLGMCRPSTYMIFNLMYHSKTQVALAFVYWLRAFDSNFSVYWVHASSCERFHQAYFSIAQTYNIPGYDDPQADILSLVKAWLEKKDRGRWVMVLDNADDTEVFYSTQLEHGSGPPSNDTEEPTYMGPYIPECDHGSILITSNNKQAALSLARGKRPIEIPRMSVDEADQLLRAVLEDEAISAEKTSQLSSRLEHLPLALAQAAAFIQGNTISIDKYIKLLDKNDSVLVNQLSEPFEAMGRDTEIPHAVTATWIVSFEQIKRRYSRAGDVLSFISFFDRQGIPEVFITDYCQSLQPETPQHSVTEEVVKAVGILKAFSFVTEAPDGIFAMHRLVQLVTRKWLVNRARSDAFAEEAIKVLAKAYPYGCYETRGICLSYLPHAEKILSHDNAYSDDANMAKALLLHRMGGLFLFQGQWSSAERHVVPALELRASTLGEEHPDTLTSMANLASTFWNQGRWKQAEELEVQVMKTSLRVLGEEHPNTLTSMANLASTILNQGRWKEAEELEKQVMKTSLRVLGEEHPDTLTSMANLASMFSTQHRWKEAEELEKQVMKTSLRVLGEEHPDTLTSMANLASTFSYQDRWKEAEELQVKELDICRRVHGKEHPNVLISIANLATTLWKQGRWKEAEELEVQVMEMRKGVLGEEHPDTLTSMNNLAHTWMSQKRSQDAISMLQNYIALATRRLGVNHPDTSVARRTLESWLKSSDE
jgi:hypothetical protein